jgi:hypothetical protein
MAIPAQQNSFRTPNRVTVFRRDDGRYLGIATSDEIDSILAAEPQALCLQPRHGRSPRWVLYLQDEDTLLLLGRRFHPHSLAGRQYVELEHLQGGEWVGLDGVQHQFMGGHRAWRHSSSALRTVTAACNAGQTVAPTRQNLLRT